MVKKRGKKVKVKGKKGGISVETIIIAILALLVLITIWLLFTGQFGNVGDTLKAIWDRIKEAFSFGGNVSPIPQ